MSEDKTTHAGLDVSTSPVACLHGHMTYDHQGIAGAAAIKCEDCGRIFALVSESGLVLPWNRAEHVAGSATDTHAILTQVVGQLERLAVFHNPIEGR